MIPKAELNQDEKKVLAASERLGIVNEVTVLYALPRIEVFAVIRTLVQRRVLERTPGGAVKIATSPIAPAAATVSTIRAEETARKPPKRPRRYFRHLNPKKDLKKQIASRIVQYLAADGYRVRYMCMYHSLGDRYRDWNRHYL